METIVLVILVLAAMGVITLVLLQHGKGADMGAAFGSGASGSLFGVSGSANLLSRATAGTMALFFVACLTMAWMAANGSGNKSVVKAPATTEAPAAVPPVTDKSADPSVPEAPKAKDIPQ
ncbi:MAG: preprotein translocase subunit SecG [Methylobacillus sp.]|jgi:preprotein translocase subunit SecG|nr:preprotein translocase subunit SecG [Methylobacillus sp.]